MRRLIDALFGEAYWLLSVVLAGFAAIWLLISGDLLLGGILALLTVGAVWVLADVGRRSRQ
ncbi:MAG: hypothetical protein M3340_03245 [Actinomycetota bacterium]|nr:hypothetical protein [Actinomycetota bacterium]